MPVVFDRNARSGDTFICDELHHRAAAQRHVYTPYRHLEGKWRIRTSDQALDGELDPIENGARPQIYDLPDYSARLCKGELPSLEFSDKAEAICHIMQLTHQGITGAVWPHPDDGAEDHLYLCEYKPGGKT